jgi:hypothetical protein
MAVATSSVKSASRASVSGARGSGSSEETARDDYWTADGGANSGATRRLRDHSRQAAVVVDASRCAGLADLGHHIGAFERPAGADPEDRSRRGDTGALRGGGVGLVAHDARERHAQDLGHLFGDKREQRLYRRALSHQRGDAAQRRLLVGELLELRVIPGARAGHAP